ncbi:hypothetical protein QT971_09460 [Microcoleus sp. herbarium19]|uniref:hypothetical protein n=1 Tax=unclassified Microcoleus TaxID=2642155 RepID=UPI002FD5ED26
MQRTDSAFLNSTFCGFVPKSWFLIIPALAEARKLSAAWNSMQSKSTKKKRRLTISPTQAVLSQTLGFFIGSHPTGLFFRHSAAVSRQKIDGALVVSFPGNIIPPGEFSSIIVKKCEQKSILAFSIGLSENLDNGVADGTG